MYEEDKEKVRAPPAISSEYQNIHLSSLRHIDFWEQ